MELTDWADGPPPCMGWWNTRLKMSDAEREERRPRLQRRWWDGEGWSMPAVVGDPFYDDEHCEDLKSMQSITAADRIEWQGLAQPPQAELGL